VSLRRCRPLPDDVAEAARRLQRIESRIALLDRVRPLNLTRELTRLRRAFETGQRATPAFEYAPRATLSPERRELTALAASLDTGSASDA
jgi:hypothetical protein